jgi:hypothetical protein
MKTYVVQQVLSTQVDTLEKLQCHNLFQIFFVIKDCRVRTIIDGGSCNNLVSADFVAKISIGTYHDYADCDVVPTQACSPLLGHPWEFDTDAIHHGRCNKYILVHIGKKITLLPLTPNEIVQCVGQ